MTSMRMPLSGISILLLAAGAGVYGCADATGPRSVEDVLLLPDSAHLEPGQTSVHEVAVLDERGDRMPAEWFPRIEWTLLTPDLAAFEVQGNEVRVTAEAQGTVRLRAELGDVRRTFNIWVRPPGLVRIEIEPDPIILSTTGIRQIATRLFNVDGQEMDPRDFRISWWIADTTLAKMGPDNRSNEGLGSVRGQGETYESGKWGTTKLFTRVSGKLATFDVQVTLEPTPIATAPLVEPKTPSSLALEWPKEWDARDGYEVERAGGPGGPWSHLAFTGLSARLPPFDTTYVDSALDPGTTYFYRVRGCNRHGCSVAPSPVASGTPGGG